MQLFFFARFHVGAGCERAAEEIVRSVLDPTRAELGCLGINAFRSTQDPQLFVIHSRWAEEAAFEIHASSAHTVNFIGGMEAVLDVPPEFTRTEMIG